MIYMVVTSFHLFGEGVRFPCLQSLPRPPDCSPRKLCTQRQGKVFSKPLVAAPTVVTATHNRLHRHGVGVGSVKPWADPSSPVGEQAPKGLEYPLLSSSGSHHCSSKEKNPPVRAPPPAPWRSQPAKGACCTFS